MIDFPPYEFEVDEGRKLFNTPFKNKESYKSCLGGIKIKYKYPYFDTKRNQVITIEQAINECRVKNGEKALKTGKGALAKISAFISYESRGQKINVKIPNKKAQQAYERGKKMFYSKSGYLNNSCATCHVQGAGNRARAEFMSPMLGAVTNYPVYRIKWQGLGTLHRRLQGCVKDQGSVKPKRQGKRLKELEYFISYMSNGMKYYGPDIRK
jgi:sulfur-oxidizing protein SoxA